MLIRFDSSSDRGPSASLFQGLVDWVRGSLATGVGTSDFDDFKPLNASNYAVGGTNSPVATAKADRTGVVTISGAAAANSDVDMQRNSYFNPSLTPILATEARVTQNAAANSPQMFVGYTDQAAGAVYTTSALTSGGTENQLGLRVNADKTIDIVSVVNGTLTVLKTGIGVSAVWSAAQRLGLRVEKITTAIYRLVPCVDGAICRAGILNVAHTLIPEVAMKPVIATTVNTTTAPSVDVDWHFTVDK